MDKSNFCGLGLATIARKSRPLSAALALACPIFAWANTQDDNALDSSAIVFECPDQKNIDAMQAAVLAYLRALGVPGEQIEVLSSATEGMLGFSLIDKKNSTGTLDLINNRDFDIKEELVRLPIVKGQFRSVLTVSKKEIAMAMLHRGRTTKFVGRGCSLEPLVDQIGIRQNIVAWTEYIDWKWPNGGAAKWNPRYWNRGDLNKRYSLHEAMNDIFFHPKRYSFGCYTATKAIVVQGILDYYRRVKGDLATAKLVEDRLMVDGDPLFNVEPGEMWFFEDGADAQDLSRPGKLLYLQKSVPARNFIPGDWVYFLNTDRESYKKVGYEGSNAIYLGRGKFDDYYNDNSGSYSYREKLNEVYQWRHRVFSRSRDVARMHPLTMKEIDRLSQTPEKGGLQLDYRAVPYQFGFEELPAIK